MKYLCDHNKTRPSDLFGYNRCMCTPWQIKMHDKCEQDDHMHLCVHDEHVDHGVHVVLVIVVECEHDGVCMKHDGFFEFAFLEI